MHIVVTTPLLSTETVLIEQLKSIGRVDTYCDVTTPYGDTLIRYLKNADAAIIGQDKIDEVLLSACPHLRFIFRFGVGLDNIDIDACKRHNVTLKWEAGINKLSVAEVTLCFMLMLCRNIHITSNELRSGLWNQNGGSYLSHKTIGIIGFGNIGKEVARLLSPFGCHLITTTKDASANVDASTSIQEVSFDELLSQSDIITIHAPLTPQTQNLFSSNEFAKMKETAFLINTARGHIVDEVALKHALETKQIAGAALDVFAVEPITDIAFLQTPNLICTPHLSGKAAEVAHELGLRAIAQLREYFAI